METTICIIIRTKNNADIIENVLNNTLPYTSDYIIYDHYSTDNTISLCNQFFNNVNGSFHLYK